MKWPSCRVIHERERVRITIVLCCVALHSTALVPLLSKQLKEFEDRKSEIDMTARQRTDLVFRGGLVALLAQYGIMAHLTYGLNRINIE